MVKGILPCRILRERVDRSRFQSDTALGEVEEDGEVVVVAVVNSAIRMETREDKRGGCRVRGRNKEGKESY